jgi:hypothetical protein
MILLGPLPLFDRLQNEPIDRVAMIFIIAIVSPFSGLKDRVDQNELGKEQQPRRLVLDGSYGIEFPAPHPPRYERQAAAISQTRSVFSFSSRIRSR